MVKKNLFLPIETKVREFQGKLLLAYWAARCGYDVYLGDQNQLNGIIDLLPRGIYINKSVAATTRDWFTFLKEKGFSICSWDEEGLLYFSPEVYKKLRLDPYSIGMVEDFFCWGSIQKEDILSYFPEHMQKFNLCGNPRFDLLREEFRGFQKKAASEYTKQYGKIILLNTNFAFYRHFRTKDELLKMLSAFPLASVPGFIDGWIEYQHAGYDAFCAFIPLLSSTYPDHSIILRPHPSEDHDSWKVLVQKFNNVVVRSDGNVQEWIAASDIVIHSNCTTAIEAFLLGVSPVNYVAQNNQAYENFLPKKLSVNVNCIEELLRVVEAVLSRESEIKSEIWSLENWQHIERYITGTKKAFSAERIVNRLDKIDSFETTKVPVSTRLERILKLKWRFVLSKYRNWKTPPDGYILHKQPGMTNDEIVQLLQRFNEVFKTDTQFKVLNVYDDVYKITVQ